MRLVISGYYGLGNAGDEAVLAGMLGLFRGLRPDIDFVVLSGSPAETERIHRVPAASRSSPVRVAALLRGADGLISGGGGLLQDVTSARPVAYYAGVMLLARVVGRPYVVHAQGLGPLRRAANRRLAAFALNHATHVSLRDDGSAQLARRIGVRHPIELTADPAITVQASRGHRPEGLVVAVRGGIGGAYLASLRDALIRLAREHRISALPMDEAVDRPACLAAIAGIPGARVLEPASSLASTLRAIGDAVAVVGVRLHALVLAAGIGVPAVAISYDAKVDAFAERAGLPVAGPASAHLDPDRLVLAVRDVLAADPAPRAARVEAMRWDARRAADASLAALTGATLPPVPVAS